MCVCMVRTVGVGPVDELELADVELLLELELLRAAAAAAARAAVHHLRGRTGLQGDRRKG